MRVLFSSLIIFVYPHKLMECDIGQTVGHIIVEVVIFTSLLGICDDSRKEVIHTGEIIEEFPYL
jgi:hypothetical protein